MSRDTISTDSIVTVQQFDAWVERHVADLLLRERDILDGLSEGEKECWVRWAIGGMEPEDIARRLRMSADTVRQRIRAARGRMRKVISRR